LAPAIAPSADDVALDDHRKPARQVHALALGRDRELDVDAGGDVAGRDAVGRGRHCLHERGVDGQGEGAVHACEGEQMPAGINHGDAFRHLHLARLGHRRFDELHCSVNGQLQRWCRVGHLLPLLIFSALLQRHSLRCHARESGHPVITDERSNVTPGILDRPLSRAMTVEGASRP
jgi:hypothetical protein